MGGGEIYFHLLFLHLVVFLEGVLISNPPTYDLRFNWYHH